MSELRLLVAGAGAVGGYFGARLAQAGRDVTFLVREQRARALRERGLEIVSPHGDVTITPKTVTVEQIDAAYDVILLAVKTYALDKAVRDIGAAMGDRSVVLPVLNGMHHIDVLASAFGASRVLGGLSIVATTLDEQGRIVQLQDFQELVYGELDGSMSARLSAIDRMMQGAGFTARASTNIVHEMWEKWFFIAALGAATSLLRGSTGQILAAPRGPELILAVLDECASVASAYGNAPRTEAYERTKGTMTQAGSNLTSSMYRDLQKGAPLEADAILGDMCARGEAAGLKLPLLNAAFAQLSIYERNREQQALVLR